MKKTDKNPDRYEMFFEKYVNKYKCPFFWLWLMKRDIEILEAEVKIKRKGLPKTGPRPMVYHKQLLTLVKTIDKLILKDFAEHFEVSYGVVRLWNREPQVKEKAAEFMILFAIDYVQELEKCVFSKKLDIEKYSLKTTKKAQALINSLLHEVKHYHPTIQDFILDLMENKTDILPDDQSTFFRVTLLHLITILSDWTIFNPPKDKKAKERFEQGIKRNGEISLVLKKAIFSNLKKMIKNDEKQKALRLCDWIEDQTLTRIKDNTDLAIKILNKGRQKGEVKRGKTVKSGKEKAEST